MGFRENKKERKENYLKRIYGYKLGPCSACNGTGYYDHNDSPECGSCDGTGKETYPGKKALEMWNILFNGNDKIKGK